MNRREKLINFARNMLGFKNKEILANTEKNHQLIGGNGTKANEEPSTTQQTHALNKQEEKFYSQSWTQDFGQMETTMIERDNRVQIVPIAEIQHGDVLLERDSEDLNYTKGAIIDQENLAIDYLDNRFIKYGEVVSNREIKIDNYIRENTVEYKDLLADYKVDKQLVQKDDEIFSLKDMYYSSAMQGGDGQDKKAVIDTAMKKDGELNKVIDKTLSLNQLNDGQSYKVLSFITADGIGRNNKILYLEDEKGNARSFGIGKQIESIDYKKGQTIQLRDVLRNSVSLLEEACKTVEKIKAIKDKEINSKPSPVKKKREFSNKKQIGMELER